jgi:hypothetical protein
MIINFDKSLAGESMTTPYELDITNDMTITGTNLASVLTLTAGSSRHFSIWPPANVTIAGLTLQGGIVEGAKAFGGSISNAANLTLNNVTFIGNQAICTNGVIASGGAIYNAGPATLTLNQCTFNQNSASGNGVIASGGAIYNAEPATLTLNQCTFNQNSASGFGSAYGGAVNNAGMLTANLSSFYNQTVTSSNNEALGGAILSSHTAVINECTLTANTVAAPNFAVGGAIESSGYLTINQSTLAGNILTGNSPQGGSVDVQSAEGGECTVFNSILGPDDGVPQDLGQNFALTGTNLIDAAPEFAPLGNYGGPTLTMPLLAGSPGIDAGDDSALNLFSTDQRGYPRLYGAHVDIGAVESTPPTLNNVSAQIISTNTVAGTYTVEFQALENPNGGLSTATAQYGQTAGTASSTVTLPDPLTPTNVSIMVAIGRNYLFNWNIVASNLMGGVTSPDMQIFLPPFPTDVAGDLNGDGTVSQGELDQVYSNYLATSPYLLITNATGLGQSNVNFTVSNGLVGSYTVQVSTDLVNWVNLGPATPLYHFTDTNAPAAPQRYYRLVYP